MIHKKQNIMKRFNTLNGLQSYLRKGNLPDCFKLQGIIYTMDFYDMEGRELSYGNQRTGNCISVQTRNRYKSTKDAQAHLDVNVGYYDHINYID